MKGRSKYPELNDPERLRHLLAEFRSVYATAQAMGITGAPITHAMDRLGVRIDPVPMARRQTVVTKRRAIELYVAGYPPESIARAIGGLSVSIVQRWVVEAGVQRTRAYGFKVSTHSALTPRGRQWQQQVRRAVDLHMCERLSNRRVAEEIGVHEQTVAAMLRSAYGRALAAYVFGPDGKGSSKIHHAQAMHAEGIDARTICRTLDIPPSLLDAWTTRMPSKNAA